MCGSLLFMKATPVSKAHCWPCNCERFMNTRKIVAECVMCCNEILMCSVGEKIAAFLHKRTDSDANLRIHCEERKHLEMGKEMEGACRWLWCLLPSCTSLLRGSVTETSKMIFPAFLKLLTMWAEPITGCETAYHSSDFYSWIELLLRCQMNRWDMNDEAQIG